MEQAVLRRSKELALNLGGILAFFAVLLLVLHVGAAFVAYLWSPELLKGFKTSISQNIPFNVALPSAAVGAFAVVFLLLHAFPPPSRDGTISFKVFGLEFTGPAGPTTLWLACFLSFVAAIRWLAVAG